MISTAEKEMLQIIFGKINNYSCANLIFLTKLYSGGLKIGSLIDIRFFLW